MATKKKLGKPRLRAKEVKAWALLDGWGDFYGYAAPYLYSTRDGAKSVRGELIDNGWRVVRVSIKVIEP